MLKIFKINSLRKKFILIVTGLLFVVFVIYSVVVILDSIKQTRKSLATGAIAFSELSTKPLSEDYELYFNSGYYKFRENFQKNLDLDKNIKKIEFINVDGNVILDSDFINEDGYYGTDYKITDSDVLENVQSSVPVYVKNPKISDEVKEIYQPYFTAWGSHPFTLRYTVSYDQVGENVARIIFQSLILILLIFILAVALISSVVNKLILTPIYFVNNTLRRISKGEYEQRVQIDTDDEIEQVADAANQMAQTLQQDIIKLKELDKLRDEFINVAAGNLKAPLTHLKLDIDYLGKRLKGKIDDKDYEFFKDIEINARQLGLLSEDLIDITTLEKTNQEGNVFVPLLLKNILTEVIENNKTAALTKNIKIDSTLDFDGDILGDSAKIEQVFSNLLDNAIKYSHNESSIEVGLSDQKDYWQVTVTDHGVGIAKEEQGKIFTKFYRAPSSAELHKGEYHKTGTGLGLYLTKLIVEIHHGNIWFESQQGKGSTFYVKLLKRDIFKVKYPA